MIRKLILLGLLWVPGQQSLAAIVNQDLEISLTIGFIGSNVPAAYSGSLNIGDNILGSITASNVDDAVDGLQSSGIGLSNHQLTIVGDSYDLAGSPYTVDEVKVIGGVVDAINYASGSISISSTLPFISYQTNNFWRILFPGWNLSDPLSDRYTISGSYHTQLSQVPIPATAWLFGSGLLGMIGMARRKRAA